MADSRRGMIKTLLNNIPRQLQNDATKALESLLKITWANQRELKILMTGKTGQGKSTLINGILGNIIAKEGAGAKRCTTSVEVHCKIIQGVPVEVFDSPGLQDRTQNEEEYIQGMKEMCKDLSLVVYCTKMINTRITDDDKHAMMKLTQAFGERFWEYSVFVLTFANAEDCYRHDDRDEDTGPEPDCEDVEGWKALIKQRFEGRLKIWENELRSFLVNEVGVSSEIVRRIPVVPTGDHKKTPLNPCPSSLPDRDDWFQKLWEACCLRVKDTRLFLEISDDRIIAEDDGSGLDDNEFENITSECGDKTNVQSTKSQEEQIKENLEVLKAYASKAQEQERKQSKNENAQPSSPPSPTKPIPPSSVVLPSSGQVQVQSQENGGGTQVVNVIVNRNVYITNTFSNQIVTETVRRSLGEQVASACKTALKTIAKPAQWFIGLFRKKT